jgi:hypothetical protein
VRCKPLKGIFRLLLSSLIKQLPLPHFPFLLKGVQKLKDLVGVAEDIVFRLTMYHKYGTISLWIKNRV